MSSIQLSFALRTSKSVKTVHCLGSWDGYAGQLPLAKNKESSKPGSWKSTFKFQGTTLQAGQRYWYYYIVDGYHVSYDPDQSSTTEPTTGRVLNILDVPPSFSSRSSHSSKSSSSSRKSSSHGSSKSLAKHSSSSTYGDPGEHRYSTTSSRRDDRRRESGIHIDIPKGRPLSYSQIQSPSPRAPYATKTILAEGFGLPPYRETINDLTDRFSHTTIDSYDGYYSSSPPSSAGSSLSSRSGSSLSSKSSISSDGSADSNCSCERYGITRAGDRIRIDCGGSRCGYSDEGCGSSSEDEYIPTNTRRYAVHVRR